MALVVYDGLTTLCPWCFMFYSYRLHCRMRAQVQKKGLFFVVQQIYHDELFKQPPQQQ